MQGVCQSTPGRAGRSKSPAFGLGTKIPGGQLAGFRRDVRVPEGRDYRSEPVSCCRVEPADQRSHLCRMRELGVTRSAQHHVARLDHRSQAYWVAFSRAVYVPNAV
jgi:hypothetical protein